MLKLLHNRSTIPLGKQLKYVCVCVCLCKAQPSYCLSDIAALIFVNANGAVLRCTKIRTIIETTLCHWVREKEDFEL